MNEKGQISTPQLRNRLVDFDESRTWKLPTMQNFISIRRCGWSRRIAKSKTLPLSLKRQFPGFMFHQVVQRH